MYVWRKVFHTEADICEKQEGVDRTVLTLSYNGNEMDVDAMLQLYDNAEEIEFSGNNEGLSGREHEVLPDKTNLSGIIVDKLSIKQKIVGKLSINDAIVDKYKINNDFIDNMTDIIMYLKDNPHSSTERLSTIVNKSVSRTKNYLQAMVELQCVIAEGGNRNRTYSITQ